MKFDVLGKKSNPAILLIHGMFCNGDSVKNFAKYLQDEYYIIIPTMDGHYEGSGDYLSKEYEAKEMLHYLHEMGVQKLELLQGTSMGAEVALEFARISDIPIAHYFYDGGPFFDFPVWFKAIMRKKFQGFKKICQGKSGEEAFEELMKNGFIRWLVGKDQESYRGMMGDFADVCNIVSDATICNVVETCYACKLPDFEEDIQKKFIFFFSEKEPAHMSKKRLIKKYKSAEFQAIPDMGHGGFQTGQPQQYAEYLKKVMNHEFSE